MTRVRTRPFDPQSLTDEQRDHDSMLEQLRSIRDDVYAAFDTAYGLATVRDLTILDAIDLGLTHQQIADATQLTRGRIGQIANAPKDNHHD